MVCSSRRVPLAVHDIDGGHDHARRAVPALKAVMLTESRLHRVQLAALGDALDGGDDAGIGLDGEDGAGLHGLSVQMNDAGAALAGVAAHMGSGES